MGDLQFIDTMLRDGLIDTFHGYHMGNTAENVAKQYQITREQQDDIRRGVPAEGVGGAEVRPVHRRDRAGHHQGPQGRHRGRG